jgi:FecR protein
MRLSGLKLVGSIFLAAVLSAPAWGANPALPGTLNYVEGQASIGEQDLNSKSVGSVDLQAGQTLTTETGKAEVLLTPGVFFRLGDDSAATMVSPNLTNTEIALNKGRAMVEVDNIHKDNVLRVQVDGANTQLLKTGLYEFNASDGAIRVFKGEALVQDGERHTKVKGGHELDVVNVPETGKLKTIKFNKNTYDDSGLYRFSNLRSEYLAEANANAATMYYPGGPGWFGAGWYWDPAFYGYTWLPGDGMFMDPFGWGFYSPLWVSYSPYFYPYGYGYGGYGYGNGYYGGQPYAYGRRPFPGGHRPYVTSARPGYAGRMGGFHGPARAGFGASHFGVMGGGFHGGGFHGGGGGFGGGFHGGGGGFHR